MMSELDRATYFAVQAFGGDRDRGGDLKVLHSMRVSYEATGEFMKIVAMLHDTVEDTAVTLHLIEVVFGQTVAEVVDALTRRKDEQYSDYIERVRSNWHARQVKLLDIRDNLREYRIGLLPAREQKSLEKRWLKAARRLV